MLEVSNLTKVYRIGSVAVSALVEVPFSVQEEGASLSPE